MIDLSDFWETGEKLNPLNHLDKAQIFNLIYARIETNTSRDVKLTLSQESTIFLSLKKTIFMNI